MLEKSEAAICHVQTPMPDEIEPPSPSGQDAPGTAREAAARVSRTGRIKALSGALTHSGKPYKIIGMEDGEKIRAFDAKQVEGLTPGMDVDYALTRNTRSGYWDLRSIRPSGAQPEAPIQSAEPSAGLDQNASEGASERDLDEHERGMRSMNALTKATTLLAALIEKDIVRPSGVEQACSLVADLHQVMLRMHRVQKPKP